MKFSKINLASLKSFIVPTLILLTIGLIVPFAFIPLLDNVKETNNKLKADQERLGILSEKVSVLDSIDESDVNDKLSRSEQVLPVGKSLASKVSSSCSLPQYAGVLICWGSEKKLRH